jgi:hypothetical protein
LIANLNVLGPVPHDIREERLILCESESILNSSEWRIDAVAGMDMQSWGEISKYFTPSSTAPYRISRCGVERLSNGSVVFSQSCAGEHFALDAD